MRVVSYGGPRQGVGRRGDRELTDDERKPVGPQRAREDDKQEPKGEDEGEKDDL